MGYLHIQCCAQILLCVLACMQVFVHVWIPNKKTTHAQTGTQMYVKIQMQTPIQPMLYTYMHADVIVCSATPRVGHVLSHRLQACTSDHK